MNTSILNREFEHPTDGWYHIEPIGEHPNRQAGVVQVIDSEAVRAIVNRFNSEVDSWRTGHGEDFPGMLIDHEHFSHDLDKETRSYGWLMRLENRANDPRKPGIYGQVNWTATGRSAVDGGDYRFFSTEYDPADLAIVNRVGQEMRARPLRLAGLTLTNRPNNKGARPITNRGRALGNSAERLASEKARAKSIANRASELQAVNPHLSLSAAFTMASTEGGESPTARAKLICNKAAELQKQISGLSPYSAFDLAKSEIDLRHTSDEYALPERVRAKIIARRALALQQSNPNLSLSAAFAMAQREGIELPKHDTKGRIRSLDALSGATGGIQ